MAGPDDTNRLGYVFSRTAIAVVGGIVLSAVIATVLRFAYGVSLNAAGAFFLTLLCILLAWAIRALVQHVPAEKKALPEPPKPPRKPSQRLTPEERAKTKGKPSWNSKPKRDWGGPDLPP